MGGEVCEGMNCILLNPNLHRHLNLALEIKITMKIKRGIAVARPN